METPSSGSNLSVNNYGGGGVVTIQVENKKCQATILVQKGTTVLLGTDSITYLGYQVLQTSDWKGQRDKTRLGMQMKIWLGKLVTPVHSFSHVLSLQLMHHH